MPITTLDLEEWSKPKKCDSCEKLISNWSHSGVYCFECGRWFCNNCRNDKIKRCVLCGSSNIINNNEIIY